MYFFLTAVSDKQGLSFYSDSTLAVRMRTAETAVVHARDELIAADLVAYHAPLTQVLFGPDATHPMSLQNPQNRPNVNMGNTGTTSLIPSSPQGAMPSRDLIGKTTPGYQPPAPMGNLPFTPYKSGPAAQGQVPFAGGMAPPGAVPYAADWDSAAGAITDGHRVQPTRLASNNDKMKRVIADVVTQRPPDDNCPVVFAWRRSAERPMICLRHWRSLNVSIHQTHAFHRG